MTDAQDANGPGQRLRHLYRRERAEAAALYKGTGRPPPPGLGPRVLVEVAAGGALGALARYLITEAIPVPVSGFPWNTFTVNMLGCLAMGVLTTYLLGGRPHPWIRPFAVTGYLGGFTTFSHLIDGVYGLGHGGDPGLGVGYAAGSVVAGWIAIVLGLSLGRRIPRRPGGGIEGGGNDGRAGGRA